MIREPVLAAFVCNNLSLIVSPLKSFSKSQDIIKMIPVNLQVKQEGITKARVIKVNKRKSN